MTTLAFALVLTSACMHAIWNYLVKRAGGDMTFVWLFSALSTLIYLPLAVYILLVERPEFTLNKIIALVGTCLVHLVYYFLLSRGYRVGDLSLVYPLARGTGPVLASMGAVILFAERPSPIVIVGTLLVALGVFILTGNPFSVAREKAAPAIAYGLLCGLSIATYTLWDKWAVSDLLIPPLILTWASGLVQMVVLTPHALKNWERVRVSWKTYWREAIVIGILDSLSYILFLIALRVSTVSLLAPVRQFSILIGAFIGVRILAEGAGRRRLAAAAVMLVGLASLALG
ncbi:MAG: DMT family transporter [Anaerolineae bacterium]|nr:DMT family transporter [Anaerolineae bacterium]